MDNIIVVGGDGFCGWPTALHLSDAGYGVTIIDNLSRRKIDETLGCQSLTPISIIQERIAAWRELTGKRIGFKLLDVDRNYNAVSRIVKKLKPMAIVHLGEQRAAPYSMKSTATKRYTVDNNINATNNLLIAIVQSGLGTQLVHLGTAGVYGYGGIGDMELPEGYMKCRVGGEEFEMMYPANPGSLYHTTKCMDALLFFFYNKNDGLPITDLHQGIVWGTQTPQTVMDDRLINRFDYDGDYGTVLNRFLMQAAVGHPLTVHGTGGQCRAFIHITDTVECIRLAIENPPNAGDRVRIINQVSEQLTLIDLANKVCELTGAEIQHCHNPRTEAVSNVLRMSNRTLLRMGLEPTLVADKLLEEVVEIAGRYKDRCDTDKIMCRSVWRTGMRIGEIRDGKKLEISC